MEDGIINLKPEMKGEKMKEVFEKVMTVIRFGGAILVGIIAPIVLVITFVVAAVGGIFINMAINRCGDLDYRIGGPTRSFALHTLGWCVKMLMSCFNWKSVKFQIDDSVDWTWGS